MVKIKFKGVFKFYKNKKLSTILVAIGFILIGVFELLPTMFISKIVNLFSNNESSILGINLQKKDLYILIILFFVSILVYYIASQQLRAYVRFKAVTYKDDLREQMQKKIVSTKPNLSPNKTNGEILDNIGHNISQLTKFTQPLYQKK